MSDAYQWLKVLHVLAASVWLGSLVTLLELNARAARDGSHAAIEMFSEQSAFIGARIAGPAAALTLLAGVGGMNLGRVAMTVWIEAGIAAFALFIVLGITVVRIASRRLKAAVRATGTSQAELVARMRRLRRWSLVNVLVLVAAAVLMVLKPL